MLLRAAFLVLYTICVFLLTFLQFLDSSSLKTSSLLTPVLQFLLDRKLTIVITCAIYVAIYGMIPVAFYTRRARNELKRKFLSRVFTELLMGDPELHRVTLFKEVRYWRALLLNYIGLARHLFSDNRWRCKFYLYPPKYGRYLIVNERLGQHFKKTSTMFRIAENSSTECDGIVGLIRYKSMSIALPDLPDLGDINFKIVESFSELRGEKRKKVESYMSDGCIKDFRTLRKMHRTSRHFFGTVITKKDGSCWGVLLIDSISPLNPFTDEVQKRFNSFAISISDTINLEV